MLAYFTFETTEQSSNPTGPVYLLIIMMLKTKSIKYLQTDVSYKNNRFMI
jgi:hypothetical protein